MIHFILFIASTKTYMAECASTSLELTEEDIPGAVLNEPLESATVHALKWWLLCRDIRVPSSWKKSQVNERCAKYIYTCLANV